MGTIFVRGGKAISAWYSAPLVSLEIVRGILRRPTCVRLSTMERRDSLWWGGAVERISNEGAPPLSPPHKVPFHPPSPSHRPVPPYFQITKHKGHSLPLLQSLLLLNPLFSSAAPPLPPELM